MTDQRKQIQSAPLANQKEFLSLLRRKKIVFWPMRLKANEQVIYIENRLSRLSWRNQKDEQSKNEKSK